MSKLGRAGWNGWVLGGLCLILSVTMSVTGAVRRPPPRPADPATVAATPGAQAAPDAALGIARAESDTLDLQLD